MGRSGSLQVPPGYRDSPTRAVSHGDVVGAYAIRHEVARTDTGVVFEARDMMLDRLVALKLAWRDPGLPSLILEARRCAAVRDPCAVAIYGMGNHQGLEYVVGERVVGKLLGQLGARLATHEYLVRFRRLVAAVSHVHDAGIAVGEVSGQTVMVDPEGRVVLGRLSLSQVPAFGPRGRVLAPEILRGDVEPTDPAAAEAIDLYGLGCVAIEMATGRAPFAPGAMADTPALLRGGLAEQLADGDDLEISEEAGSAAGAKRGFGDPELRGHAREAPPQISTTRQDLPGELSDLVDWLLAKQPEARPRSAKDVLAQLDAIMERLGAVARALRVLVVDDDATRAHWLWSLARRGHAAAQVEIASEGSDATHKLHRDLPDLVFVSAGLRGVMNAYELCMYARGLETEHQPQLVLVGETTERDRALFAEAAVPCVQDDVALGSAVLELVRGAVREPPRRRRPRSTISG